MLNIQEKLRIAVLVSKAAFQFIQGELLCSVENLKLVNWNFFPVHY